MTEQRKDTSYFGCKKLKTNNIADYFLIDSALGKGGFGSVYKAAPKQSAIEEIGKDLPSQVAIKVLTIADGDARMVKYQADLLRNEIRFLKMTKLLPHACKYYGCFEETIKPPTVYLVMELINGDTLFDIIAQYPYKMPLIVFEIRDMIVRHIVEGIKELHAVGIVHHDLKPANIMVNMPRRISKYDDIKVKILDYGLSCYQNPSDPVKRVGSCTSNSGTPGYIDKRITKYDLDLSPIDSAKLGDWWAFGIIALEIYGATILSEEFDKDRLRVVQLISDDRTLNKESKAKGVLLSKLTDSELNQIDRPSPKEINMMFLPGQCDDLAPQSIFTGPSVITEVDAVYPEESKLNKEQGMVKFRVWVNTDGTIDDIIVISSSGHKRLDEAAKKALSQWTFAPARRNGVPEKAPFVQTLGFQL
jgi:TonB family protein